MDHRVHICKHQPTAALHISYSIHSTIYTLFTRATTNTNNIMSITNTILVLVLRLHLLIIAYA